MDDYTHLYGLRTPYKENGMEARVRYPLYIVIYCKRVHYTADSLVWGSLRLAPISHQSTQIIKPFKRCHRTLQAHFSQHTAQFDTLYPHYILLLKFIRINIIAAISWPPPLIPHIFSLRPHYFSQVDSFLCGYT